MNLDGQHIAVWDTAGLDEGSQGSVPAEKAEAYLKQLLHELAKNNGVDLLVYCVRGTRVRSALLTNYHIFYSAICRKKVPIAIVITGLENQEGDMETWWIKNEPQFSSLKMYFDNHACVTTLDSFTETAILKERREVSKVAVINMIISTCRIQRWKPHERSWIESAYADIRAMLAPKDGYSMRPYTIILCETFRNCPGRRLTRKRSISFQNPVAFSFSSLSFRSPISISNDSSQRKLPFQDGVKSVLDRLYHVYQVPRQQTSREDTNEETKMAMVVKRGADLLIFCVKMEETESRVVKSQWEHFNLTYGGDLSPRIVVVVGATDQSSAQKWWQDAVGETPSKDDVDVAYCPNNEAGFEVEAARKQLQLLINDRCIDCNVKATSTKNEKLFRRSLVLDMSSLTTLWVKQENNSKDDELPSPERDILTNMGVWVEVLRSPCIASPVSPKESQGQYSMYQPY
ncbi:hypothetical protein J3R82DRAFT_10877 [Butyriboletus roseoflavus]|nr:hypothetical protein J3R82DRAFT_10877 [Butyriboletus roseoflavus]